MASTKAAARPDPQHAAAAVGAHKRVTKPYLQAQVVHYKPRVSVLDKELTTVSYHGLVNFGLLLLSATLIRLAIENYMKYGILVSIPGGTVAWIDWLMSLLGVAIVAVTFVVGYVIERSAIPTLGKGKRTRGDVGVPKEEKRTVILHLLNLGFVLVGPGCVTYFGIFQPALGTFVMMCSCIMFLKLYSWAATNFDLRRAYRLGDAKLENDPMRFAHLRRGQLIVEKQPDDGSHSGNDDDDSSDEDSDKDEDVEELVKEVIPITTRASFSLNARALDGIHVAGDDRIDAKADALPRPRPRLRTKTVDGTAEILREMAESKNSSTTTIVEATESQPEEPARVGMSHPIDYKVAYPKNVTLGNFLYFWAAPTLCYQPSYPRMPGPVRKSFVAKRITELLICCLAMYIAIQQYAMPTLVGSVMAIDKRDAFWLSERVLKLSVISAGVWFLGFYAIFHAGLNASAELLGFADRAFYLDWWNSVDLAAYWREWNLPIHYFCKRHIMMPLVSAPLSLSPHLGVLLTFVVSAVMHELLFGIPTHSLKGYSFFGMLFQIPLIQLTQWLVRWRGPESGLGNAVFWISFCIVGQPLGVVQYYYDWVKNNP
ncbi:hypothetical protein FBU59_003109 [Linderina macrospora]|uniref:Uncharacterized protein n=1 Tax=Linderina macrospora TaxID=4868 RepID=A0ACC1J9F9_9FUNG|nr:hypothetical protein FBU59_003109 [Linderina macrospora]